MLSSWTSRLSSAFCLDWGRYEIEDCSWDGKPSFWAFADKMSVSIWNHEPEMPTSLGWVSGFLNFGTAVHKRRIYEQRNWSLFCNMKKNIFNIKSSWLLFSSKSIKCSKYTVVPCVCYLPPHLLNSSNKLCILFILYTLHKAQCLGYLCIDLYPQNGLMEWVWTLGPDKLRFK